MLAIQWMLLAHVLTDFVFQWDKLVDLKKSRNLKGFLYHGIILFFIQFIFLITIYRISSVVVFSLLLVLLHLLTDYIKEYIPSNTAIKRLGIFLGDQLVHILIIVFLFIRFTFVEHTFFTNILTNIFSIQLNILVFNNLVTAVIILIYLCFGGAIFIRLTLDVIYRNVDNYMQAIAPDDLDKMDPIKEVKVGKFHRHQRMRSKDMEKKTNQQIAMQVSWISIGSNVVLSVFKLFRGLIFSKEKVENSNN